MLSLPIILLIFCCLCMLLLWWLQGLRGNAGYVDVLWTALIGLQALIYGALGDGSILMRVLAAGLGMLWAGRLTLYLFRRLYGEAEDGRYRAMRQHWEAVWPSRSFFFFQAQALVAWLFGWVFWVVAQSPQSEWSPWILVGIAIWLLAVLGESLADRQLARFKAAQPGKVCNIGLWRYSRHPNYFFEWVHWLAYPLIAWGADHAWIVWLAPLLMGLFLYRVTGIPYTEKQALRSKGDDYRKYQATTAEFFPWPPKRDAEL